MLEKVKLALRVTTNDFNDEIADMINAAFADLGIVGVSASPDDPLLIRAVTTYCKLHFGELDSNVYDRLKASYDEQKAQLITATGYGLE